MVLLKAVNRKFLLGNQNGSSMALLQKPLLGSFIFKSLAVKKLF